MSNARQNVESNEVCLRLCKKDICFNGKKVEQFQHEFVNNNIIHITMNFDHKCVSFKVFDNENNMKCVLKSDNMGFDSLGKYHVCGVVCVERIGWKFTILQYL